MSSLLIATQKNSTTGSPYFSEVAMLVHGSSSTTGNTTQTFLDSSTNNITISNTGTFAQGSFGPYGTDWGNYFNGSSYLLYGSSANFGFGTGDFTVECWINPISASTSLFIDFRSSVTNTACGIGLNSNLTPFYYDGPANTSTSSATALKPGTWYHIALVRLSGVWKLYVNGTSVATTTDASNLNSANPCRIGQNVNGTANGFVGHISNVRVTKGTALYTTTFTPPTKHLSTSTGTTLLTCSKNGFVDASGLNAAPTLAGAPTVSKFNPFGNEGNVYTTSSYGGSIYFNNNSSSYLSCIPGNATAFGTGDFTIEFWFYTEQSLSTNGAIFDNRNNTNAQFSAGGYDTSYTSGFGFSGQTTNLGYNGTINQNQWYHVAYVRKSGTATLYLNGVSIGTAADTYSYAASPNQMIIGHRYTTPQMPWYGYITDLRFVSGTAVYTANFTPPTSPLTAISGTTFLLGARNANIVDRAQNYNWASSGAVISTSQSKFNGSSLNISGSSYINGVNPSNLMSFGTGDFTVESWVYPTTTPNGSYIIDARAAGGTGSWAFYMGNTGNNFSWFDGNATHNSNIAISVNAWTHLAAVRYNGTTTLYINGSAATSWSDTINYSTSSNIWIGTYSGSPGVNCWQGYLQEMRISRFAQYTANFTPPTSSFVNG